MGGCGMLLDDEDAGADAADRELLVALDRRRLRLDLLDPREGRTGRRNASNFSTAGPAPSAWTCTVRSSRFFTQPLTPSSRAHRSVASRKPMP